LSGVLLEDWRLVRELFPASRSGPAVVAVDRGAWELGVRPGLPLAEARSLARPVLRRGAKSVAGGGAAVQPAVQFEEWRPEEDRRELEELALIARRFAPVVSLDALPLPDSLLLDITGCEHLFGGELELAEELLGEVWGSGLRAVAGIGGGKVLGAASWRVRRLPCGEDRPWLDMLPITAGRLPLSDIEILRDLGVVQLGRLLNLPREDLPARLSVVAVERVQQLQGVLSEHLVNLPEANPIESEWSEEQPASGLGDLHWVLGRLSGVLSGELVRRRQMCGGLECEVKLGSGEWLQFGAGLVRPTQDAGLLGEVICLRLEYLLSDEQRRIAVGGLSSAVGASAVGGVEGTAAAAGAGGFLRLVVEPVVLVRMRALAAQLPPARQRNLFGELQDVSEPVEQLAALVSRLTGRLGRERVLRLGERADVRPEYSVRVEPLPDAVQAGGAGAAERALWNLAGLSGGVGGVGIGGVGGVKSGRGAVVAGAELVGDLAGVLPRPLRLLEPAVDVTVGLLREVEEPVGSRSPLQWREQLRRVPLVVAEGQRWEVEWWSGAERLQTGWWTDRPCQRDYYVVRVRGGGRLWLYRDLQTGRWYLQGFFD